MKLKLYNSATKSKEDFIPRDPKRVTMYVCGPTVYSYAHIGNARPAITFDLLFRVLTRIQVQSGGEVIYARNITDVDDKIIDRAVSEGVDALTIADRYATIYQQDMASLNVKTPTIQPRVTEHMGAIITQIQQIITNGHAYVQDGHVLFDVSSFPDHGALSGRGQEDEGHSRLADMSYKRSPLDFVLWKPAKPDEPSWDSPWSKGRPGWHIECSAMIAENLGMPIDIHGGGEDLLFPHHENERSQGLCAQGTCGHDHGHEYARYWMHNAFLTVGEDHTKMAKSTGNVLLVRELLEQYNGDTLRTAFMSAHYRTPLNWDDNTLKQAKARLDGLYAAILHADDNHIPAFFKAPSAEIMAAMTDDLNTPEALAIMSKYASEIHTAPDMLSKSNAYSELVSAGRFLGILGMNAVEWFQWGVSWEQQEIIERTIDERDKLRAQKNWAGADVLKQDLKAMGIEVLDKKNGTTWRVA